MPSDAEAQIDQALRRRRDAAAAAWRLTDQVVLIGAGAPVPIPGRGDPTYPFRAHSEYLYLTDRNRPGGVLAFDPAEGWVDFVAPITDAERLWTGAPSDGVGGPTTAELDAWLEDRAARPCAGLGSPPPTGDYDPSLTDELRDALNRIRWAKDEVELERMRVAQRITTAAFAAVIPVLRHGATERQAQIELEAAAFRAGAQTMAYETIVASGPNSAVLHFAPSSRVMREGELVLIDAGAEWREYAADITRTYPVGGNLVPERRELHAVVRAAELAAIERCAAGVEWRDVHLAAAEVIADGLIEFGVLRGERDALLESGAVRLFFPHGVGHLVGLGVRDAVGGLPERRGEPPPYPNLRIDLPLIPGMVVTVEPGIYFVPALLGDPDTRSRHRDDVDWGRVERMLDFGGIRIEDNVLITEAGHEVISDVPLLP